METNNKSGMESDKASINKELTNKIYSLTLDWYNMDTSHNHHF